MCTKCVVVGRERLSSAKAGEHRHRACVPRGHRIIIAHNLHAHAQLHTGGGPPPGALLLDSVFTTHVQSMDLKVDETQELIVYAFPNEVCLYVCVCFAHDCMNVCLVCVCAVEVPACVYM